MSTTDELKVKLTADSSSFSSAMRTAKQNAKEFGETAERSADKAGKAFSDLKGAIIGLGIGQALKTSITDAMNAVESESLFQVSLGKYANQARAWSEEMSSALALDGYSLRKNLGVLYNMTTSMGLASGEAYELSTGLTALAEDMASFYNLSSEDAFMKLRSGLTGEAEPLKALGILVDEATTKQYALKSGLAVAGEELTNQQKVLARYAAILGQTTNAQGDLARTMDSPANQLRATMNDLKQVSIEFGMALMPIVQTALPILRDVIADIKPVAVDVATGLGVIGSALSVLESPATRGVIYVGLATAAIKKLNLALGSTATGLLLIGTVLSYIIGEYSTAQEEADSVVSTTFDGASIAADGAKESTDNLTKSLGEAGKAASRLAGFDEITKLSGGNTGTSGLSAQFVDAADAAENATGFIQEYENALASVSNGNWTVSPNLDLSKVDWSRLEEDIRRITDDFTKIFTGNEEERFSALKRLDDKVRELFGDEWSDFWSGVGDDIFKAFNDFGSDESYQALYNLNERLKSIPFSETFQNIGRAFGGGLADITAGVEKFLSGDFDAAGELFNSAMNKSNEVVVEVVDNTPLGMFLGPVGQGAKWLSQTATDFRNADFSLTEAFDAEKQKAVAMESEKQGGFSDALKKMEAAVISYLLQGVGPELALQRAKVDFYDPSSMLGGDFVEWYQELPEHEKLEGKVHGWAKDLRVYANGDLSTPATAEDIYSILQAMPGGGMTGPIQLNNVIELDGEAMKAWTRNWQSEEVTVTNGR